MRPSGAQPGSVAIVCGSSTVVGHALVTRLHQSAWDVVAADPPGAKSHPAAWLSLRIGLVSASMAASTGA